MSMIDPMTGLPTPTSYLNPNLAPTSSLGSQLLGGAGGGLLGTAAGARAGSGGLGARLLGGGLGARLGAPLAGLGGRLGLSNASLAGAGGRLAMGGGKGLLGGALRGGAVRGLGGYLLGEAGAGLVEGLVPGEGSTVEQGLRGAARGAAAGATLGAPLLGIGAVPGALLGGALGGAADLFNLSGVAEDIPIIGGFFGGGEKTEEVNPAALLNQAMAVAQMDPTTRADIMRQYTLETLLASRVEDEARRDALKAQALDNATATILSYQGQGAGSQMSMSGPSLLALQQQASEIFEPIASDIEASGDIYAQAMAGIRDNLPADYRAIADAQVAREMSSSDRLANAYRAQAAMTPVISRLTQYQQDFNNYAAQMFSQQLAQQAAGGYGGAGGADLAALLAG